MEMDVVYEGDLHCRAVHGPSGAELATDAPVDNHGRGAAFSPTDLLTTSLGVCMMTVMGIHARAREIDLKGSKIHLTKEMVADPQRRVGRVTAQIDLPADVDAKQRPALEHAARTCPVRLSLNPQVEVGLKFRYV